VYVSQWWTTPCINYVHVLVNFLKFMKALNFHGGMRSPNSSCKCFVNEFCKYSDCKSTNKSRHNLRCQRYLWLSRASVASNYDWFLYKNTKIPVLARSKYGDRFPCSWYSRTYSYRIASHLIDHLRIIKNEYINVIFVIFIQAGEM